MQPNLHQTAKLPPIQNKNSIQIYDSDQLVNKTMDIVPYTKQQQNVVKFASMSSSQQRNFKPHQNQSMTSRLMNRLYKRSTSIEKRLQKIPTSKHNMNHSLLSSSYNRLLDDVTDIPLRPKLPKVTRITLPAMSERPGPLRMGDMLIQESAALNTSLPGDQPMAIDLLDIPNNAFSSSALVSRQQPQIIHTKSVTFKNAVGTDFLDKSLTLRQQLQIQPARKKPRQLGTEKLSTAFTANFQSMKKPTPHDFIKLIQTDKRYQSRFCYCKKSSPQFYSFQVVPYAIKDPKEFMTISARGVVHYIGDEVDYLSLTEWQREFKLYKQIRDIFFFKQYRYWKNFSLWKTLMRRTRIQIQRDYLRTKLLLTDPQLGSPLQIIRTTTFRLTRFTIVDLGCDRPMTLEQFEKSQHDVRKKLKRDVAAIENEIKQKLIQSCDNSMEVFRQQNRITLSQDAISGGDSERIARANDDDDQNKNAFLVGDDTRKQMPYTQKATMRQQCK